MKIRSAWAAEGTIDRLQNWQIPENQSPDVRTSCYIITQPCTVHACQDVGHGRCSVYHTDMSPQPKSLPVGELWRGQCRVTSLNTIHPIAPVWGRTLHMGFYMEVFMNTRCCTLVHSFCFFNPIHPKETALSKLSVMLCTAHELFMVGASFLLTWMHIHTQLWYVFHITQ